MMIFLSCTSDILVECYVSEVEAGGIVISSGRIYQ